MCAHCNVRAASSTAPVHCRSAPSTLLDHQASLRSGERGRAALLLTWRAPPPMAAIQQLRKCSSALRATLLTRLRTPQPFTGRQPNASAAGQAQKRLHQAHATRTLGNRDYAHCSVRAGSPTARSHRWSAPLPLPGNQKSLRSEERGSAAPLPTWRAPPSTAVLQQLRRCFSALRATALMHLRTCSRQQGVS